MRAWFFSENAYHLLPDSREYDSIRVKLPNRYYDPKIGADLYHRFIDEWKIAEDLGLEIMVNEHHQTATNLNPSAAVVMGALARDTRKARLLILGVDGDEHVAEAAAELRGQRLHGFAHELLELLHADPERSPPAAHGVPKRRRKLAVVARATSSTETPFTSASRSAMRGRYDDSFGLPRNGTGAR